MTHDKYTIHDVIYENDSSTSNSWTGCKMSTNLSRSLPILKRVLVDESYTVSVLNLGRYNRSSQTRELEVQCIGEEEGILRFQKDKFDINKTIVFWSSILLQGIVIVPFSGVKENKVFPY